MSLPLRVLYQAQTIPEVIERNRQVHPERKCITVANGEAEFTYSYQTLWDRSLAVAGFLSKNTKIGDRVVLAMPTSPEFIDWFFGCLVSGRIAVPLPVEKPNGRFSRGKSVVADCSPSLMVFRNKTDLEKMNDGTYTVKFVTTDEIELEATPLSNASAASLQSNHAAFIQYTSGSTSDPKGVVLTHGNLLANIRMIQQGMGLTPDERVVSWLPLHHDMGLIGNLLSFVATSAWTYLFPYQEFARNPMSWIEQLSQQKATLTGAPTFAFDLISKRVEKTPMSSIDLSSLRLLYCGSERISAEVVGSFYRKLAPYGLRTTSFFPCYGLAEASLYVSGGFHDAQSIGNAIVDQRGYPLCGRIAAGLDVRIISDDGNMLPPGEIGELEIQGASVSVGYWKHISNDVKDGEFRGRSPSWLKTGDLGLNFSGEIAITGRIKDLIKIRGKNIYPDDIEGPVEALTEWIASNSAVAVCETSAIGAPEELVFVVEIVRNKREGPFESLLGSIQTLLSEFELKCDRLVVLSPGSLPRTSSGKKQRRRTSAMLASGDLKVIWDSGSVFKSALPAADLKPTHQNDGTSTVAGLLHSLENIVASTNLGLADERRTFPAHLLLRLKSEGFLRLLLPKESGGMGLSSSEFAIVSEALGATSLSIGAIVGIHNTIGILPIVYSKKLESRAEVLTQIASKGSIAAFAITEASAGSNPRSISSQVRRYENKLVLNGEKIWIGNGTFAEFISVFAQEFDQSGKLLGVSAFLLRSDKHHFSVSEEQLTVGLRAMPQNRIEFKNLELSDSDRLSEPGEGLSLAYAAMEYARFGLGALATGAMKVAFNSALRYASTRKIWTGLLSENEYFRGTMIELGLKIKVLESLVRKIATDLDSSSELPQIASLSCKILAGEWSSNVVDQALQFMGGRGYTETVGLGRAWRDVRIIRIFEGPTETLAFQLGSLIQRSPESLSKLVKPSSSRCKELLAGYETALRKAAAILGDQEAPQALGVYSGLSAAKALSTAIYLEQPSCSNHEADLISQMMTDEGNELVANLRRYSISNRQKMRPLLFDAIAAPTSSGHAFYDTWSGLDESPISEKSITPAFAMPVARTNTPKPEMKLEPATPRTSTPDTKPAVSPHDNQPPADSTSPSFRNEKVVTEVTAWLEQKTKIRGIQQDKPISEYGVDSLLAYELLCFIDETYKISVPESVLTQKPTLSALSDIVTAALHKSGTEGARKVS